MPKIYREANPRKTTCVRWDNTSGEEITGRSTRATSSQVQYSTVGGEIKSVAPCVRCVLMGSEEVRAAGQQAGAAGERWLRGKAGEEGSDDGVKVLVHCE